MTSPFKYDWKSVHGKWLFLLTAAVLGLLWAVGVNAWNEWGRPKKENYTQVHKDIAELKRKVKALEVK